ncbi:MAG: lipid IV(A) 3-deoxy-D-manno-octulosonic acid transferase [Steroidobacteraceae bacterium]
MARILYSILVALLAPIALLMERRRAQGVPGRVAERLGRTRARASHSIWVHAVSMGEVQAAAPLVRALFERYPDRPLVITTTTSTGAQRVAELFGERVQHAYLPLDVPWAVRRFLAAIDPAIAIVLETELWPNVFAECGARNVPVLVASARLSERSVRRYTALNRIFGGLIARTLGSVHIAAQSTVDRDRFAAIGAPSDRLVVAGNLKFDVRVPETAAAAGRELRAVLGAHRPVWIAGSTHEQEEAILLAAHAQLSTLYPTALLVVVPRHPQRFDAAAAQIERTGLAFARRSHGETPRAGQSVLLADTMGELQSFYAAGDVAFVGGTLLPVGGHNLLEPAALGRPVLCGPNTFNAPDIAAQLEQAGALTVVKSAAELAATLSSLFADENRWAQMGRAGQSVIATNRGACERVLALAAKLLPPR